MIKDAFICHYGNGTVFPDLYQFPVVPVGNRLFTMFDSIGLQGLQGFNGCNGIPALVGIYTNGVVGTNCFPDGPDTLTVVARLTEDPSTVSNTNPFNVAGRISWSESQA